jgi:hypothetical protein
MAPFSYNTGTGVGSILKNTAALGKDRGLHFSSAMDDTRKFLTTAFWQPRCPGKYDEVLYSVNTVTETRTRSNHTLPPKAFAGNSIATIPGYPGSWHVAVTQRVSASVTGVYNVDVATADIDPKEFQVPWTADPTNAHPALTVARTFFELSPSTPASFGYLLQPCNLAYPQQLARVDLTTLDVTVVDLQTDNFCLHAPGLMFGNMFALATFGVLGQKEQLAQINPDDGSVFLRTEAPETFTMSRCAKQDTTMEFTPYVYSFATQSLYAMSGNQKTLARFGLDAPAFPITVGPWTRPDKCRAGIEVHSFAGILQS